MFSSIFFEEIMLFLTLLEISLGYTLFDDEVKIDSNELVFYNEDDPRCFCKVNWFSGRYYRFL